MISLEQRGEELIVIGVSRYDIDMIEAALSQRAEYLFEQGKSAAALEYLSAYYEVRNLIDVLIDEESYC